MERTSESRPLVSVIIPVFNCEKYLAEALDSALAQTYSPTEVIVVDDGSTDGSREVARGFAKQGVRYFYQPNSGIGAARNKGTDVARGGFFAFLDADDLWLPDKLTLQMEAFEEDPDLDMVFSQIEEFSCSSSEGPFEARTKADGRALVGYAPSALLVKRESFLRVGPFATHWRVGEFVDWYAKAADMGLKSSMVPYVVVRRRIHDDNVGIRERPSQSDYVRILKQALDRRREKGPGGA